MNPTSPGPADEGGPGRPRALFSDLLADPRATQQANVPPASANLPLRFWIALVLTGIGAGLGAILMMAILRAVQHTAFGYHLGEYSTAVAASSYLRRIVVLAVGGVVAGIGWWVLRNKTGGTGGEPTSSVWSGQGNLDLGRTLVSGALSEVAIGMGGSLGREAAPQHAGAAVASWVSRRLSLSTDQRVLLVACGAGAGVGAVYNVPFAGALFAAELYLGSLSLTTVIPALAVSSIATAVSWLTLPRQSLYRVPHLAFPDLSLMLFAILVGPVIGLISAGYVRLIEWAGDRRAEGWRLVVQPVIVFAVLGVAAIEYPLLLGNGRDLAQFAFDGTNPAFMTLGALLVLKPVFTSFCLRSGASGGLFTPTFSFGAVTGALAGEAWLLLWPGPRPVDFAIVGAAAMLAAAMQSPVAAIVFAIELTNTVNSTMVAIILAVVGAVIVSRRFELLSIYSARISQPADKPKPTPTGDPDPDRSE